jgi:TetR/AcrR family transcriptional regulator, regulator of cefoperazone and chloramphenicol sensitivity
MNLNHPKRIVSIDRHDKSYRGDTDSCQTTNPVGILSMPIHKTNSRGKDTRSRLLSVATQLFSDRGYEGVSTREIAAAANTTLPAIPHHFGSKEGLYQAVFAAIAEDMERQLSPAATAALAVLDNERASRAAMINALENLVLVHARAFLQNPSAWGQLVVREQLHPTAALVTVNQVLERRLFDPLLRLIARLTHSSSKRSQVKLKVMTWLGRVLVFRFARTSLLNLMGWEELNPARINLILEFLRLEVRALARQKLPNE